MEYLLLSLCILSLVLGIMVIIRDPKENINKAFLVFALSISVWTFNGYYRQPNPPLEVIRLSYGLATLIGLAYLIWIYYFLQKSIPRVFFYFVIPIAFTLFSMMAFTDLGIKNLRSVNPLGFDGDLGAFYPLITAFFTLVIFSSLYYLVKGRMNTSDPVRKKKISIIIWGISLFALTAFSVDFWIPRVFGKSHYTLFDNISFLIILCCMAYVMLKHIVVPIKNNLPTPEVKDTAIENNVPISNLESEKTYGEYMNKTPKVADTSDVDSTYKNM